MFANMEEIRARESLEFIGNVSSLMPGEDKDAARRYRALLVAKAFREQPQLAAKVLMQLGVTAGDLYEVPTDALGGTGIS